MGIRVKTTSALLRLGCHGSAARVAPPARAAARLAPSSARTRRSCRHAVATPLLYGFRPHPFGATIRAFTAVGGSTRGTKGADGDYTLSQVKAEAAKLTQQGKQVHTETGEEVIYEGSIAHQVRRLKRISITTCAISILAIPAVVMFGKESVTTVGQVAVMGTALVGTGSSTLLLNLCVSPYVTKMSEVFEIEQGAEKDDAVSTERRATKKRIGTLTSSGRRFRAERMNIFGLRKTTEFSIDEVEPMPNTSRPFVSFKAGDEHFFVQGQDMDDKVLLQTLLGRELKDHEK